MVSFCVATIALPMLPHRGHGVLRSPAFSTGVRNSLPYSAHLSSDIDSAIQDSATQRRREESSVCVGSVGRRQQTKKVDPGSQTHNLRVTALWTPQLRVCKPLVNNPRHYEAKEQEDLQKLRPAPRFPESSWTFVATVRTPDVRLCHCLHLPYQHPSDIYWRCGDIPQPPSQPPNKPRQSLPGTPPHYQSVLATRGPPDNPEGLRNIPETASALRHSALTTPCQPGLRTTRGVRRAVAAPKTVAAMP